MRPLGSLGYLLATLLAVTACDDEPRPDAQLSPEPVPSPVIAPEPPKPNLAFALVHEKTDLHEGPHASTPSFRAKDRVAGGRAEGGAVLFALDGEQPESAAWVRLTATDRVGRCGYQPLAVEAPVYVKRAELMRTVVEAITIDGPGSTRIELRPGVALRPSDDAKRLTVTTKETRIELPFDPTSLATDLGEDALDPVEPAPEPSASSPAPSGSAIAKSAALKTAAHYGMVGLLGGPSVEALRVGPHRVRLSTFHPPTLKPVEGQSDQLAHLASPCVDVVGVEVRRPDPLAFDFGGSSLGSDPLSALGGLSGDSIGESFGGGGLGLGSVGTISRGGGGTGEGGLGRGGLGTGRGAGRGAAGFGRARATRGQLSVGTTHTTRGLSDAVVARLVRSRQGRLGVCYRQGLERDPSLRGRVLLSFTIQLDGRVGSGRSVPKSVSQPNGTDLSDPAVVSCVVRALSGITFPQPDGERPVKAKVELNLRP